MVMLLIMEDHEASIGARRWRLSLGQQTLGVFMKCTAIFTSGARTVGVLLCGMSIVVVVGIQKR